MMGGELLSLDKQCLPAGGRYCGREMSSFFIFQCKVERFMPKREAAPLGPPSTQSVSRSARGCPRGFGLSQRSPGGWRHTALTPCPSPAAEYSGGRGGVSAA